MGFLVFWILFALWGSWLAPKKGKGGTAGFLLGLIFGVFYIVYLYCQPDVRS